MMTRSIRDAIDLTGLLLEQIVDIHHNQSCIELVDKKRGVPATVTRRELAEVVYAAVSLPRKETAQLVDEVIGEICDALVRDGVLKLTNFGTFTVVSKAERMGRNPKTNTEHLIAARKVIKFKPAAGLKRKINGVDDKTLD